MLDIEDIQAIDDTIKEVGEITKNSKNIVDNAKTIIPFFKRLTSKHLFIILLVTTSGFLIKNNNLLWVLYQDKIPNHAFSHSNEISERDISSKVKEKTEENVFTIKQEKAEIIAVEFASDRVFEKGIAASCINSKFFNKSIELKDPLNIENNSAVDVVKPINCNSQTEKNSLNKCGGFPRVQIPFSEARKLYPLQYNPEKNINTLGRCGLAEVEIR